jgi:hypothetical protein
VKASSRIVVDALSAQVGGGLTYITEQLKALKRVRPDLDLSVLVSQTNIESLKSLDLPLHLVRYPNLASRLIYEQVLMPYRTGDPDLLYCPANFCPLRPTRFPIVLTLRNAHHFGPGRRMPARSKARKRTEILLARASVKRADAVIVVSEALRRDLRSDGLDGPQVHVIRSGAPEWPPASETPRGLGPEDDFFLSLANDQPAKRLDDVVLAWRTAFFSAAHYPSLVFVGDIGAAKRASHRAIAGETMSDGLVYLGKIVDRAQVKWLLEHARAMVSASELESFGLTVVEAGSLGCLALVTDLPPHRETADRQVKFFSPGDCEALAGLMAESGRRSERSDRWQWAVTWENNASELAKVFDSLIS